MDSISYTTSSNVSPQFMAIFFVVIFALIIWSLVWKGLAMWKAAKNGSKWWFVIMLIVNTVGILDIIYYFFVDNQPKDPTNTTNNI